MEVLNSEQCQRLNDVRTDRAGESGQRREGKRSQNIRRENREPEPHCRPEVSLLGQHESDGVERVFGKELRTAQNDDDEAERIKHLCDELDLGRRAQHSEGDRIAERRETHEDAAGKAGEAERDGGSFELLARVLRDLEEDLFRAGSLEIFLCNSCGLLGLFAAAKSDRHRDSLTRGQW